MSFWPPRDDNDDSDEPTLAPEIIWQELHHYRGVQTTSFVSICHWLPRQHLALLVTHCQLRGWGWLHCSQRDTHARSSAPADTNTQRTRQSRPAGLSYVSSSAALVLSRKKPLSFSLTVGEFWPQAWLTGCGHALRMMLTTAAWLGRADFPQVLHRTNQSDAITFQF